MKKSILLLSLLIITLSYGQTKKKKKSPKVTTEIVKNYETHQDNNDKKDIPIQIMVDKHVVNANDYQSENSINENSIFSSDGIEIKPEFIGGTSALKKFIFANIKFEPVDIDENIVGKVYIGFVVEKDGNLTDLKVLRDIGYGSSEEVIRVIKMMPKWKPGNHDGKNVRTLMTLPVEITIPKKAK